MSLEDKCIHRKKSSVWCEKTSRIAFPKTCELCNYYESGRTRFIELYRNSAGVCYDTDEIEI